MNEYKLKDFEFLFTSKRVNIVNAVASKSRGWTAKSALYGIGEDISEYLEKKTKQRWDRGSVNALLSTIITEAPDFFEIKRNARSDGKNGTIVFIKFIPPIVQSTHIPFEPEPQSFKNEVYLNKEIASLREEMNLFSSSLSKNKFLAVETNKRIDSNISTLINKLNMCINLLEKNNSNDIDSIYNRIDAIGDAVNSKMKTLDYIIGQLKSKNIDPF